ncbi:hypothetical protein G9U51_15145 [Calidifontibacter sp. DB0510]|uniref:DinB-like domain-containing protein n=1 Tax=Metallococcus carri TaxID=1656884 RepID=A0A967EBA6_9MICO|nr:pentapeptide repeat-containing protein [Metallococcus carri]NHN57105.1 hypothetical protein [Metallococcus carri]NOP39026.1 hypothetical protein [Calidifontibacter sp. DB2511S]
MTDKEFVEADLSGARFTRCNLSQAVLRGVEISGADIDAPWLLEGGNSLWVNGIDVVPYAEDGYDLSVFTSGTPAYADVLEAFAGRQAMVRDYLASVTPQDLTVERVHPWSPQHTETTLHCLHTILEEEWEHHRYAVRDLDRIAAGGSAPE